MKQMKVFVTISLFVLAALSLATNAFSQREIAGDAGGGNPPPPPEGMPAGPPPHMPGMTVMHAGANGLFVLEGNVLTKYRADTLEQAGILQLGETAALPDPAENKDGLPRMRPPMGAPGAFIITGAGNDEMILAVVGNSFYRVGTNDFTIAAHTELPAVKNDPPQGGNPNQPAAGTGKGRGAGNNPRNGAGPAGERGANADARPNAGGQGQGGPGMGGPGMGRPGMMGGPGGRRGALPLLEVRGDTLYVLRANQLLAINIATGKLNAQGTTSGKLMGGAPK